MNRTMKETNIPWLGKIPNDWQICRFKDLAVSKKEIIGEKAEDYERLALTLNGVIKRGKDDDKGLQPSDFFTYQILNAGDFVFKMIDLQNVATSRVGLSPFTGLVSPAYVRFVPNIGINQDFYYFYLMSLYYQKVYNNIAGDGVRSALNARDLGLIACPIPPKEEQIKIVEAIKDKEERINALIANEVKQIEKLKAYKQALISEVVIKGLDPNVPMKDSGVDWIDEIPSRWGVKRFKELFSIDKGLSITKADLTIDGAQVISYGQIHSKRNKSYKIDNRLIRYVNSEFAKQYSKSLVKIGDFIIADTSEDIAGSGDFVFNDMYDTYAGYHTIILRAKNDYILGKFIAFLMMSDYWKRQIQSRVSGVKVYSISARILSKTTFLIPSETDCHNIVHFLSKRMSLIDKDILNKQRKIELLKSYHQSIIYEYITGKKTSNGSEEKAL